MGYPVTLKVEFPEKALPADHLLPALHGHTPLHSVIFYRYSRRRYSLYLLVGNLIYR